VELVVCFGPLFWLFFCEFGSGSGSLQKTDLSALQKRGALPVVPTSLVLPKNHHLQQLFRILRLKKSPLHSCLCISASLSLVGLDLLDAYHESTPLVLLPQIPHTPDPNPSTPSRGPYSYLLHANDEALIQFFPSMGAPFTCCRLSTPRFARPDGGRVNLRP
jgi:hypothetical protein